MAASAPDAVFRREITSGQMCWCRGVVDSPAGLELLTTEVVGQWVASGDEYRASLDDENVGGMYGPPRIIRRWTLGVLLPGVISCDPAVVAISRVVRRLFIFLFYLRNLL